jgi:tetratricopeptide (TPR) repeat protein
MDCREKVVVGAHDSTPLDACICCGLVLIAIASASCRSPTDRLLAEGDALREAGDHKAAAGRYRRAIDSEPQNHYAHYSLASALYAAEDYPGAIEAIENALTSEDAGDDALSEYLWLRGNARTRLGRLDGALEDYRRAIEVNPGLKKAYYAVGIAYYNKHDYPQASEWLKRYLGMVHDPEKRRRVRALIDVVDE